MKPRNKLAIVTVHNGAGFDLNKTLKSIDDQINKPDLSLVVAKQLNNFHKDIYKKIIEILLLEGINLYGTL